jgi:dolichol kinase
MDRETERQLFHMVVGLGAMALLLLMGRTAAMASVFIVIVVGTVLMNLRLLGADIQPVRWFEERFEREGAPLPGWGSACYAAGALIAITFLQDVQQIAAVIFILGIGDGLSTIIGMRGKLRLPYNRKKTWEGTAALFLASLGSFAFVGPAAVPLAFVAAAAESLPWIDDNLSVPIACTALLLVMA